MKKFLFFFLSAVFLFSVAVENAGAAKLSEEKLAKKKEGYYVTGLPLINYTSDDGLGYGARVYLYNNGNKGDEYYDETPYFMALYAQFYMTTTGKMYHELNLDNYNVLGTKYRVKAFFAYDYDQNANFFGVGSITTERKLFDSSFNTYDTYADYFDEFLDAGNKENYKYNKYQIAKPTFNLDFFGPIANNINFILGVQVMYADIKTWQGKDFKIKGDEYTQLNPTLFDILDPTGADGGWTNNFRVGIAYDTRDFEPDPTKGTNIDYSFVISPKAMGSEEYYNRSTVGARYWLTPVKDLTFVGRVAYTNAFGDIPFYEAPYFWFPFKRQHGLGANRTLRGYKKYRFVGETMTCANAEARFKFWEVAGGGQRFVFKVAVYGDIGNAYDDWDEPFSDPRWDDYKYSYGAALVIAWNQATIVHFAYSMSPEDSAISIDFDHAIY